MMWNNKKKEERERADVEGREREIKEREKKANIMN